MAAMASMPEVTSEDSISRRGSAVSLPRSRDNIHGQRPNSHTQHAAAIAAATTTTAAAGGHLGGPRAQPTSLKDSRSWSFTRFDDKTKRSLADSVSEASQTSESRVRVGGPRPLAASDIAVKTGVLPPPVCTEPRETPQQYSQQQHQQQPQHMQQHQQLQQQAYQQYSTDPEKAGSETGGGGGWKSDWWALRTVAGWVSPAGSGATTPVSTPGVGPSPGPMGSRSRAARLSTVAEDWVPAGGISGSGNNNGDGAYHRNSPSPPTRPPLIRVTPDNGHHDVHAVDRAGIPTPPPAAASRPVRAPTAARVRLVRAQEALKSQARAKTAARVVLTRPAHLAGDRRGAVEEGRLSPARPPLQSSLSIPGSYVDE